MAEQGEPRIVSVVSLDGRDEPGLLSLAAGLAPGLEDSLATAIFETVREREIPVTPIERIRETTSAGVAGSVAGHDVVLGNSALFAELGLSLDGLGDWPERMRRQGQQVVLVAVDGRTAGFLGVARTPPETDK